MPSDLNYLDFDVEIERAGDAYRAQVLNSPAGSATAEFKLPFSDVELENFLLRVGRPRRGVRRLESPEMQAAKGFGGKLFDAVFAGDLKGCFRSSVDEASRQGAGLRVRLRFPDAPELGDVPWEYLYNTSVNRFLTLSNETPLVRYMDLPERIRPLAVTPPLQMLVMISAPSDYDPLDVEDEWKKLSASLDDLQKRGLISVERLDDATLSALQKKLRQGTYHIFHFIGHGGFDERSQDGVLVLEDAQEKSRPVSAQYLGTLLHDHRPLRLAVLNACEGARTSRTDPFAGVAQSLVQQGVPAVIAMQFEITDDAAITFGHEFYGAVADGYPVDAALAEARKAIFAEGNDIEWGTPVLYLRAPDGRIFSVAHDGQPAAPTKPVPPTQKPSAVPEKQVEAKQPALPPEQVTPPPREKVAPEPPVRSPERVEPKPAPVVEPVRRSKLPLILGGLVVAALLLAFGASRLIQPSTTPTPEPTPAPGAPSSAGMVKIPSGKYVIGSNDRGVNHAPKQEIELSEFWIDRHEVTNAEYAHFVSNGGAAPPANWVGGTFPSGHENHPVQGVTWQNAADYCAALQKRLPTEAEWEVAARGPDALIYPWGNDGSEVKLPTRGTYDVESIAANKSAFGAFDMAGNVWEWVGEPYQPIGAGQKLLRGGAYDFPNDLTYRLEGDPNGSIMIASAGIRCAASRVSGG